ncbi:hypothetical protein SAMN00808754_2989 [Thermanaeromonas toyohensis ToBE]|uniref:Uncharacterized protein n=1 Tax=Thermanaeromonas toyohensis ToBE TaxID=698762 RepID=A0A1W1W1V5_9FIRM|nr:hypothetical protein [Thermanaeromonas toyohensis]SMB99602.1 hypothetical protein SAMN00808754_2989 [Thermanaeromonas toyohensis ToBE]
MSKLIMRAIAFLVALAVIVIGSLYAYVEWFDHRVTLGWVGGRVFSKFPSIGLKVRHIDTGSRSRRFIGC